MQDKLKKGRSGFIDIAKGLGIILVVFGHVIPGSWEKLSIIIYGFHMPMFFFISGIFAGKREENFVKYIAKQFKRLLLPFLAVFFIGCIVTFIVPIWEIPTPKQILNQLIYARPLDLQVGPIWFLAAMFNVTVIFYIYHKLILSKNDLVLTLFSLSFVSLIAFYLPIIESKVGFYLPFKLDVSLMALVFYVIGYLSKQQVLADKKTNRNLMLEIFLFFMCIVTIIIIPIYINGSTFLSGGLYGNGVFMYILPAMSGTYIVLKISKAISKNRFLEYIGKNSLVIFSVHSVFTGIYNYYIVNRIDNKYLSLASSIFATVVILLIMIAISLLLNKIKSFNLKNKAK